jgi:transposase
MVAIITGLNRPSKRRLRRVAHRSKDAGLRARICIVLNLATGVSPTMTARCLCVSRTTVYKVARRFREDGEAGLVDRREENGAEKLDEAYLSVLWEVVRSGPEEHGWQRPTWTREMLAATLKKKTGTDIHVSTMSRALAWIGARRGKPKPTVGCPWEKRKKQRRLRAIGKLVAYEDEVDIHLNPKIGLDWMVCGQQKEVITPGQNVKRYLAGALDAHTGELIYVEGEKKTSLLFIELLWELTQHYAQATKIHVILDNYSIHHTEQVRMSLATQQGQRLKLHFLPPYCPDHNRIERAWQDLHANVTRNHTCRDMPTLMTKVRAYLKRRNRESEQEYAAAA